MKEVLLFSGTDITISNHICLILKENGIPYNKKIAGTGEYFAIATGNTFNNEIQVFVNETDFNKASELISVINQTYESASIIDLPDELKDIPPEEEKEMENAIKRNKKLSKIFILSFIFAPLIICIIITIIANIFF